MMPPIKTEFGEAGPCEVQLTISRILAMQNERYDWGNSQKYLPDRRNKLPGAQKTWKWGRVQTEKCRYLKKKKEHQTTRHKAGAENQDVTQRTEHTSLYERSGPRDLYQLKGISQHKMKMFSPSHALLVIFGGGGKGAGEGIRIWMYIYTYTYIFMVGPLCCIEQTISGHFSIFKNTFWQFKWITPSHFHFGPTTAFLFLILYVSP